MAQSGILKMPLLLFSINDAAFAPMFRYVPMLCLRCAQIGVKLPQKGAKLWHAGADLDFRIICIHVHQMA